MNEEKVRTNLGISTELYDKTIKRLTEEQIRELLHERLKDYAELKYPFPDKQLFEDFMDYAKEKREELAKYPPETISALLTTLEELAPKEDWVRINVIAAALAKKMSSYDDQKSIHENGWKTGNLLRLLGFKKRKRDFLGIYVLVEHDLLKHYKKEAI